MGNHARPVVIALAGLPGAGKSTLARALCERFSLSLVNRDTLRDAMFPDCRYTEAEKHAAEQAVRERVVENCSTGRNSLIDGMTFGRCAVREAFAALARACDATFSVIWLDCPVAEARRRVAADCDHVAADRVPGLVDRSAAHFETPGPEALRIDGALAPADVVETASRFLIGQVKLESKP